MNNQHTHVCETATEPGSLALSEQGVLSSDGYVALPSWLHEPLPQCRFFTQGYCDLGDSCSSSHREAPLSRGLGEGNEVDRQQTLENPPMTESDNAAFITNDDQWGWLEPQHPPTNSQISTATSITAVPSPFEAESTISATKTKRGMFSKETRLILEEAFELKPYPAQSEVEAIAEEAMIKPQQVRTWFANRRNRSNPSQNTASVESQANYEASDGMVGNDSHDLLSNSGHRLTRRSLEELRKQIEAGKLPNNNGYYGSIARSYAASSRISRGSKKSCVSAQTYASGTTRAGRKGRRQWPKPVKDKGKSQAKPGATFPCSFCPEKFLVKWNWRRHEEAVHVHPYKWLCNLPRDFISSETGHWQLNELSLDMKSPAFFSALLHNSPDKCGVEDKDVHVYYRQDGLTQHLQNVHKLDTSGISSAYFDLWRVKTDVAKEHLTCPCCAKEFTDWDTRVHHVATHFSSEAIFPVVMQPEVDARPYIEGPKNEVTDPSLYRRDIQACGRYQATPGRMEPLDPSFKCPRNPREFFVLGKVFRIMWPDIRGTINNGTSVSVITTSSDNSNISGPNLIVKFRWFVVIKSGTNYCSCLPITTYRRRGVSKPSLVKAQHSIIYTGKDEPIPLHGEIPSDGELGMLPSIRVNPKRRTDKLDSTARIDYNKIYTVDHYVKVKEFGDVHQKDLKRLRKQWWYTFKRSIEDLDSDSDPVEEGNPWRSESPPTENGGYIFWVTAKCNYQDDRNSMMTLEQGDRIGVSKLLMENWWEGFNTRTNEVILFPSECVEKA